MKSVLDTMFNAKDSEIAKKLGFVSPSKPADRSVDTTEVIGYWNANLWPVAFTINRLGGIPVQLRQRGDFVVSSTGQKVNDPVLEEYCGPGMLSRELSRNGPVPVVRFPTPVQSTTPTPSGVHSVNFMPADGKMPPAPPQPPPTNASSASVKAMDVETAKKLRFIKPVKQVHETMVEDTAGAPLRGDQIPDMDSQVPEDIGPSGRLPTPPGVLAAAIPENPQQEALVQSLAAAAAAPRPDTAFNLPQPDLTGQAPAPAPKVKHACRSCGKGFEFQSLLKRHILQVHSSQSDALLQEHGLA